MKEQGLGTDPHFRMSVYEWKVCMITRKEEAENEAVQCFLQFIKGMDRKIKSGGDSSGRNPKQKQNRMEIYA